jgi:hypothetical protein
MVLEVSLRGYRLPKSSSKLDVVIVAAQYAKRSKQLKLGQAYVRRGPIWGDLTLIDRKQLLQRLESKQHVVTGKPAEIPGEFVVFGQVQLDQVNGDQGLHAGDVPEKGDNLGVPLF